MELTMQAREIKSLSLAIDEFMDFHSVNLGKDLHCHS
jgi:hypothetical protein